MVDTLARVTPHSEEAEIGVLGCILIDPDTSLDICVQKKLHAGKFYIPAHRILVNEISQMMANGDAIDLLSVSERMKMNGTLDAIGGPQYLNNLVDQAPTSTHLEYHIGQMEKADLKRQIIDVMREGNSQVYTCDDPESLRSKLEGALSSLNTQIDEKSSEAIFCEIEKDIEDAQSGKPVEIGLSTGYPELDEISGGGLRNGGVYWLSGQEKAGKTSLKCNIIRNVLLLGHKVGDLTLEMTIRQELEKMCGIHGKLNVTRVITNKAVKEDIDNLHTIKSARELFIESGLLRITDRQSVRRTSEVKSWARRMVYKHGCELLAIDYLQKMLIDGEERLGIEAATTAKSSVLQELAGELGIPILVVAAVNADGKVRGSRMADYDGSGHWRLEYNPEDVRLPPNYAYDVDLVTQNARFGVPHKKLQLRCEGATGEFYDRNRTTSRDIDEFEDHIESNADFFTT